MKIIDISVPISNQTLVHPSESFLKIEPNRTFEEHGVRTSKITFGSHTGTHVDAGSHFLKDGMGADRIDLEKCIGKCQVVEISSDTSKIEENDLVGKIKEKRVLFKTKNSSFWDKPYTKEITTLGESGAEYLLKEKVELVGIDYTGIEASGSVGHPVHVRLLEREVTIVEGLDLSKVSEGKYELILLPLRLEGLDGSPARAILVESPPQPSP